MKAGALLLWLTLFGAGDGPSNLMIEPRPAFEATTAAWVGEWLVGETRRPVTAAFTPVKGNERVLARLLFGSAADARPEEWIGRIEQGRLRLSRSGIGEAHLAATETGLLQGRLARLSETGAVTFSPRP